jgi:hypothetical protein
MTKKKPETATDRANATGAKKAVRRKAKAADLVTVTDGFREAAEVEAASPITAGTDRVSVIPAADPVVPEPVVQHTYHVGGYDFVA